VTLGRPVALEEPGSAPAPAEQPSIAAVSWNPPAGDCPPRVVRGQDSEPPPPPPPPPLPPPPPPPAAGEEGYNCGVATTNPGATNPFWDGTKRLLAGLKGTGATEPPCGRHPFESDHCFDNFISPVTNPFLFEDPRALTEVRPIIIYQSIPDKNYLFKGGDMEFFGLQGRVAFSPNWSLVINKLGLIAIQPASGSFLHDANSISEIDLGPKFTFLRSDACKTVGAVGLTFQIPAGTSATFQNTGTLSLVPYLSMAQQFGKTPWGSFDALGTLGYALSVDNQRSEYLFLSLHLDFNVGDLNKIYPFLEMNWFHYTAGGQARNFGFEGTDLINFGSAHVGGDDDNLSFAVGARYKFSECFQAGIATEFPINGRHDLMDFRLTFDLIFRY
jgi:hypothetical protein